MHSIVGVFTIFVTDASLCRHVFNHNGADSLLLQLHPSAKNILGERNIAFLHGAEHKALRKSFIALFTRKALGVYVRKQDKIIRWAGWTDACCYVHWWVGKDGNVAMLEQDVEAVHRSRQHAGSAGQVAHPTCCCPVP